MRVREASVWVKVVAEDTGSDKCVSHPERSDEVVAWKK